jgi:hypothetical protein
VINRDATGTIAASELHLKPRVQRMIVRDLTDDTEGNATGIGLADVVLRRAVERMDPVPTYMNLITAKSPDGAKIPITVENDRQALQIALACCIKVEAETARLMRICDTKHLEELWVSESLLPEVAALGKVEPLGDPAPIAFDAAGVFAE